MPQPAGQSPQANISEQDPRPLYLQIAAELRDAIGHGTLPEETRAPSIHELARFHSVNPTTSSKALNALVEEGLLEKRRGLGMFVLKGARHKVLKRRRQGFAEQFITPLITEAKSLGITSAELCELIAAQWQESLTRTEKAE